MAPRHCYTNARRGGCALFYRNPWHEREKFRPAGKTRQHLFVLLCNYNVEEKERGRERRNVKRAKAEKGGEKLTRWTRKIRAANRLRKLFVGLSAMLIADISNKLRKVHCNYTQDPLNIRNDSRSHGTAPAIFMYDRRGRIVAFNFFRTKVKTSLRQIITSLKHW